jgi:hypothetical protein
MAGKHLLVAFSNPVPGKEEEYNAWYGGPHIAEVLKIPGFLAAQRFRLSEQQMEGTSCPWCYLVIYEIDAESPGAALRELERRIGTEAMVLSPALDPDLKAWTYSALEPRQLRVAP